MFALKPGLRSITQHTGLVRAPNVLHAPLILSLPFLLFSHPRYAGPLDRLAPTSFALTLSLGTHVFLVPPSHLVLTFATTYNQVGYSVLPPCP